MSNLLFQMLNHIGVDAYRTWIGSRSRPYSYYEVPTTNVDNHMITTAIIDGKTIFLDATDSYVPFGMPSAFIQGKDALIGIDSEKFKIETVPIQDQTQSLSTVASQFTLEDGILKVSEKRALTGYEKVEFVSDYTYKKADVTDEEFLNTTLALGNNKTKYTNFTKGNFNNKNVPLILDYNLSIDNYAKTVENKVYINLNIDRTLSKSKIDVEARKYSKKIDYKFQKHFTTKFKVPEGYKTSYLPKDLSFENPNYGFNITYRLEGDTIIQNKSVYINTLSIKKEEFESWNSYIKSLIKAYKKSIILEKI